MKSFLIFILSLTTLATFAQIPKTLTNADKIYGLSKFWSEVNYNFVYLNKIDRNNWDSTYHSLITSVQLTQNDYEYYRELQKFCALLKDGHTNVFFPLGIDTLVYHSNFGKYRLFLENIDNKAIIVRTNRSIKEDIPVGSEILEVNGLSTLEYIKQNVSPYISSSTDYVLMDLAIQNLLDGIEGQKYRIKIKTPSNQIKTLTLKHKRTVEEEVYPPFDDMPLMDFKWYNEIAYISLNSFEDPKIDTLFIHKIAEIYKAKGLIIDLRFNGGGSTDIGLEILKYLTNDSIFWGAKSSSRDHIPVFKAWGEYVEPKDTINNEWAKKSLLCFQDSYFYTIDYYPDTLISALKKIIVPTVILIGHGTASAAEDFLLYTDNQKHMTKIGENSCGSTGQPYTFRLPGGGSARVCTKKDTYPDGREFVGYGVKPDIEVIPTVSDFLKNNDPVMLKALDFLKTKLDLK